MLSAKATGAAHPPGPKTSAPWTATVAPTSAGMQGMEAASVGVPKRSTPKVAPNAQAAGGQKGTFPGCPAHIAGTPVHPPRSIEIDCPRSGGPLGVIVSGPQPVATKL